MAFAPSLFGIESAHLDFAVLGAIGLFGGMLTNVAEKPFAMRGIRRIGGKSSECDADEISERESGDLC